MEQKYTVSIFSKIFYGGVAAGVMTFFIVLMSTGPVGHPAALLFPLPFIGFCICVLINLFKSKVIISGNNITRIRLFYNRSLQFQDIKGCRISDKIIILEPKDELTPKLKISNYIDFGKSDELKAFVAKQFQDLDKLDLETDERKFLQNNNFGYSTEEKKQNLTKAKLTANIYNSFGMIAGLASIVITGSYLEFFFALLYPFLGILIMAFSHGLITFVSSKKKSINPFIVLGFYMPPLILLFYSLDSFEIYRYENLWLPFLGVTMVMCLALFKTGVNRSIGGITGQLVLMFVLSAIYGLGSIRTVNCEFDKSTPQKYKTTVAEEYTTTGKGSHYHIKLNPWTPGDSVREIDVGRSDYQRTPIGTTVTVNMKKGFLHIPWYYVDL